MPYKKHETDAGWDLRASESIAIGKSKVRKVGTGVKVEIPVGHVGLVFPRSGLSTEKGLNLANVIGVIDSDYRGEIIAAIKNNGDRTLRIKQYDRICQLVILPINLDKLEIVNELTDTERGEGGFGSTNEKAKQESAKPVNNEKTEKKNDENKNAS